VPATAADDVESPDPGYGWVMVSIFATTETVSYGVSWAAGSIPTVPGC